MRLVQHHAQELQRAPQRLVERAGVQHRMAQQREAAAPHRARGGFEEFVVERTGDREPQPAVLLRRDGPRTAAGRPAARSTASVGRPCRRRHASASSTKSGEIICGPIFLPPPDMAKAITILDSVCH